MNRQSLTACEIETTNSQDIINTLGDNKHYIKLVSSGITQIEMVCKLIVMASSNLQVLLGIVFS